MNWYLSDSQRILLNEKKRCQRTYIICFFYTRKKRKCTCIYFCQKKHRKNKPETNEYKWVLNFSTFT